MSYKVLYALRYFAFIPDIGCFAFLCVNPTPLSAFPRAMLWISSFLFFSAFSFAADTTKVEKPNRNKHPLHRFYVATGAELIFAYGDLRDDSLQIENKMRFSLFPHIQQQYHYNFTKGLGFYTGMSLINVGFRNIITSPEYGDFELRQRSMSFGVPLALKLGNMEKGNYIAFGATGEIMFRYKYKLYNDGYKNKYGDWFSDKVNVFNYSVFVDLRNKTGGYVRFKYYLADFLSPVTHPFYISNNLPAEHVELIPTQSTLFYISIGSTFMKKKPRPLTLEDV
jgi:hypothetical protein